MLPKAVVPRVMVVPGKPRKDAALEHLDKIPAGKPRNESLPVFLLALIKLIVILVNSHSPSLPLSVFLP